MTVDLSRGKNNIQPSPIEEIQPWQIISMTMEVLSPARSAMLIRVQAPPADKALHQPVTERVSLCKEENISISGQKKKEGTIGGIKNLTS